MEKSNAGNVHVEVLRKGKPMSFDLRYPLTEVDVAKLYQSMEMLARKSATPAPAPPAATPPSGVKLEIDVRPVNEADVAEFHLAKPRGIVVVGVDKGGLGDKIGLMPEDVILEVNNSEIGDVDIFVQIVRSGALKKFHVWRKGEAIDLAMPQSL